ncbi:helix-turn-helix transcriptional regulator [Sinorhizobium psoraleae]|uniref:Helix-turn-helix transcriptional regulator n=1 Tax=Sinorhizobium psoraleae TaxID=520838 RepID=A0ABT4KI72_9HYPH|nr:helix-turn-helix transcriptional regulator [Sinorhizobium psoraleae]MCZ4091673.1 helix-turn-helix transcriptional regulator [Sinorhizobium psoraleae]
MSEILKERIKSRMAALGKNPSSVALEAELGRSAVRDILSGKAKNPGYATVAAIARVLDCSVQYLTGRWRRFTPRRQTISSLQSMLAHPISVAFWKPVCFGRSSVRT